MDIRRRQPMGVELVKRGIVTEADIERALKYQRENQNRKIGDILYMLDVCDPNTLIEAIGEMIGAKGILLRENMIKIKLEDYISLDVAKELIKRNIICEERTISAIAQAILINGIEVKEDKEKDKKIEEILAIMKKDEAKLKEIETGVSYSYDCEFGNVTDYHIVTSNNQVAKRECMHLKPVNIVIPVSENKKIGLNVKYILAMDDNSIELPYIDKVTESIEPFGNFYTCVGYADSICNIYISKNQKETNEYIWLEKDEILELVRQNKVKNGIVLATLLKYLLFN